MKISNKFTLMRVCFAPVFYIIYNLPIWFESSILAKISAFVMIPLLAFFELTDYWDGHYARKNNEVSDFGKIFDPFADVMLNLSIFLSVSKSFSPDAKGFMPLVIFVFILYREFSMTFLRMVAISNGTAIAARKGGKFKTCVYISSGFIALAIESALRLGFNIEFLGVLKNVSLCFFILCVVLSYVSFIDYIKTFYKVFKGENK